MASLSHVLSITDALQLHVDESVRNGDKLSPLSADEAKAAESAKSKALNSISSTIASLERALNSLKCVPDVPKTRQAATRKLGQQYNSKDMSDLNSDLYKPSGGNARTASIGDPNEEAAEKTYEDLDGKGALNGQIKTLSEMVERAQPILDTFDATLKRPYLQNYNATMNTVPVLGIKEGNVMYIEKVASVVPGFKPYEKWSIFDKLPEDLKMAADMALHLFPYKGDVYVSNGTSLWKKAHRTESDPEIKKAVNQFPKLYVNGWSKVGDDCLPAPDLVSIIPFAVISASRDVVEFRCVTLARDGKLSCFTGDVLGPNSGLEFKHMTYKNKDGLVEPKWLQMAYWNGGICSYDDQDYTWDLAPDFSTHEYTISGKLKVSSMTEFTADDIGPIGLQADGFIYRRYNKVRDDPDRDIETEWTKWISLDGVSHLGVASPGVMLDLRLLTATLRARYIDTQVSLYYPVESIMAFGTTHTTFLKKAQEKAKEWKAASEPEKKQLALEQGSAYLIHAQAWAEMMHDDIGSGKETVNIMTSQLRDVKNQLEVQLTLLRDKLVSLQATLKTQKEALSKMQAAFWGMIATMFVGIAVVIGGILSGNVAALVVGGLLFAGGLVAMAVFATKMSDLSADIATTEAQIRECENAIDQLSTVVKDFTNLDEAYSSLNEFWGALWNQAAVVLINDKVSVKLGTRILQDPSSIETAIEATDRMTVGAQAYLNMLNRQGIKPRSNVSAESSSLTSSEGTAKASNSHLQAKENKDRAIAGLHDHLAKGDLNGYTKSLATVATHHKTVRMAASMSVTSTGAWFDVAKLSTDSSVLTTKNPMPTSDSKSLAKRSIGGAESAGERARRMNGLLATVRPQVIALLKDTIDAGRICAGWAEKFPTIPDQQKLPEAKAIQKEALEACSKARSSAGEAMRTFADFNEEATLFQRDVEGNISETENEKQAVRAKFQSEMNNISVPWYIYPLGPAAVLAYIATERTKIADAERKALGGLDRSIDTLKQWLQSGLNVDGDAATWITMVQNVSGHLGDIYNTLAGVRGQIWENPALYQELMDVEWTRIDRDAEDVLNILGYRRQQSKTVTPARPMPKIVRAGGAKVEESDKERFLTSVKPSSKLGGSISGQTTSLKTCFASLDKLMILPYTHDITGYWEKEETERETLYDVIYRLRAQYVNMISTQYNSIQQIYATALLQQKRAENVQKGKVDVEFFFEQTLSDIQSANKVAQIAQDRFGQSAEDFKAVLVRIEKNINDNVKTIETLNTNIDKVEKEIRDKIIWVIADTIALVFASAALLAAFGVFGPVASAVALATKIGLAAAATAASVKVVLDSMSLADLVQTIESLKATTRTLQSSVDELKVVQPLFKDVVNGMATVANVIDDMELTLTINLSTIQYWEGISLSNSDVDVIKKTWEAVYEDCDAWLTEVNRQGINPIRGSVVPFKAEK